MKKKLIIRSCIIGAAMLVTFFYLMSQKPQADYAPFALSADALQINVIASNPIMEGTAEDDFMIADPAGSEIFAKGGLNYIVAKEGDDILFFSLCSAKIKDGKVTVVEGFDPKHDKLSIFCAHNQISQDMISIIHDTVQGKAVTYVEIQGKHSKTAIALLGDIDIQPSDIILNEKWHPASKR